MLSQSLRLFVRLSRPLYLLAGVLLYALGGGIARYLGVPIKSDAYLLGQIWVLMVQLSIHYLLDYFADPAAEENPRINPFGGSTGVLGPGKIPRPAALWMALTALSVAAWLTVLLIRQGWVSSPTLLILMLIVVGAVFYTVPPVRLADSGYGELTVSILMANLLPAFAFLLQSGNLHRLVPMTTFPLLALHLVMILANEFPDFARDVKYERSNLLVRMGWRNGMTVHNLLILSAFLLLGLAATFGLPNPIALPAFLPLPLGLLEIWQMSRIRAGANPNWRLLTTTAIILFFSTSYLLTLSFWTR